MRGYVFLNRRTHQSRLTKRRYDAADYFKPQQTAVVGRDNMLKEAFVVVVTSAAGSNVFVKLRCCCCCCRC